MHILTYYFLRLNEIFKFFHGGQIINYGDYKYCKYKIAVKIKAEIIPERPVRRQKRNGKRMH